MAAKRPGYRNAIAWIADNDDTAWLEDAEPIPSVTACMVGDLFEKTEEEVIRDLKQALKKRADAEGQ